MRREGGREGGWGTEKNGRSNEECVDERAREGEWVLV